MSGQPDPDLTQPDRTAEGPVWRHAAKRAYDASFGKIRQDLASIRNEIHSLIGGIEAKQATLNADVNQRFMELAQRIEKLDRDVRTIAAGRMELEAVTRHLAALEDRLIDASEADLPSSSEPSDQRSS